MFISTNKHKAIRVRDLREIQMLQEEVRRLVGEVTTLHNANVALVEDRSSLEYEISEVKRAKEELLRLNRELENRIRSLNGRL